MHIYTYIKSTRASQIFTVFLIYFSRTKSTECEGVSCSQEAKVSIPRRVGSRPRKGCARTSKGVGDGKSFMENFLSSIILFRSTIPLLRRISHVYIHIHIYIYAVSHETGRYNKSFRKEEVLAICDLSYTPIIPAAPPSPSFFKITRFSIMQSWPTHLIHSLSEKELQPSPGIRCTGLFFRVR